MKHSCTITVWLAVNDEDEIHYASSWKEDVDIFIENDDRPFKLVTAEAEVSYDV